VDAITEEEYKRKWAERENKRTRYNPAAAQQRGGRRTRIHRSRTSARTSTRTTKYVSVSQIHAITKLEWKKKKVTSYPLSLWTLDKHNNAPTSYKRKLKITNTNICS
jgi:hypothetical protein